MTDWDTLSSNVVFICPPHPTQTWHQVAQWWGEGGKLLVTNHDPCDTGVPAVIGVFLFRLREGAFGRGRRLACLYIQWGFAQAHAPKQIEDSLHPLRGRVSVEKRGPTGKCKSNWEVCGWRPRGVFGGYLGGMRRYSDRFQGILLIWISLRCGS